MENQLTGCNFPGSWSSDPALDEQLTQDLILFNSCFHCLPPPLLRRSCLVSCDVDIHTCTPCIRTYLHLYTTSAISPPNQAKPSLATPNQAVPKPGEAKPSQSKNRAAPRKNWPVQARPSQGEPSQAQQSHKSRAEPRNTIRLVDPQASRKHAYLENSEQEAGAGVCWSLARLVLTKPFQP